MNTGSGRHRTGGILSQSQFPVPFDTLPTILPFSLESSLHRLECCKSGTSAFRTLFNPTKLVGEAPPEETALADVSRGLSIISRLLRTTLDRHPRRIIIDPLRSHDDGEFEQVGRTQEPPTTGNCSRNIEHLRYPQTPLTETMCRFLEPAIEPLPSASTMYGVSPLLIRTRRSFEGLQVTFFAPHHGVIQMTNIMLSESDIILQCRKGCSSTVKIRIAHDTSDCF